jgi:prephenate dehydrogenase
MINSVRIVGAGLIGTSIGLALRNASIDVQMIDIDEHAQRLSNDLIKGATVENPDLIVVAVPVLVNEKVVLEQLKSNSSATVCDIASVKSDLLHKVEQLSDNSENFVSLHPMAGRELTGAEAARADLFQARAWVAIKSEKSSQQALSNASEFIKICGGTAYWLTPGEHDLVVAKTSHLPQLLSSAMATQLLGMSEHNLNIAGQGLRDVTRLAQSDPLLWSEIFIQNKAAINPALTKLIADLTKVLKNLEDSNTSELINFLSDGVAGKKLIPGKHGAKERNYSYLPIVIDDKPGQLARIFNECSQIGVNVEDLNIEHSPGQETGLITLALSEADCKKLSTHLHEQGFKVHQVKNR